jgi:hypothetical protein
MRNVQLYFGRNVYDMGTIRPRGIGRVDFSKAESMARSLGRVLQRGEVRLGASDAARTAAAAPTSAEVLRAVLFHDALGPRAEAYPSDLLAGLDLTAQAVELGRPMLVAEIDAAAATLALEGEPSAPAIEQKTVVRVILDVAADVP